MGITSPPFPANRRSGTEYQPIEPRTDSTNGLTHIFTKHFDLFGSHVDKQGLRATTHRPHSHRPHHISRYNPRKLEQSARSGRGRSSPSHNQTAELSSFLTDRLRHAGRTGRHWLRPGHAPHA